MKEHEANNLEKLINFVNPDILKGNLICCSLYMAFYETTKDYIINQPKSFFTNGFDSETGDIISPSYKEKVLSLDSNRSILKSSLIWFKNNEAISDEDIANFEALRKYRNVIAHEMLDKLYEGLDTNFNKHFEELITLRLKLERWWVFNIEIPTGDFENPQEIKDEEVITSSQMIYNLILDVLSQDEEKSKYYYTEFLKFKQNQAE